ncbi:MAG TPA: O-antigen ligase family protein [Patescibacteria group bacterium]|nr:O-antigen ligase family protein [Patescibacteria group bacterium]
MGLFLNVFSLWLAALPLIVLKAGYEGPKVFYFLAGCVFLVVFWIIRIFRKPESVSFLRKDAFFSLWLLILAISSAFGIHPIDSILGGSNRHQGVLFFLGLFLVGKTINLLNKNQKALFIKRVGTVVLIESVIVALQFALGNTYFGKPLGTIGEANAVAGFLAGGSFFVFESFPKAFLLLPFAGIVLMLSRSGILAGLVALPAYTKGITKVRKYIPVILLLFSAVIIVLSSQKGGSYFENRTVIWRLGLEKVLQKPLLGYGAETGEAVFNDAFYQSGFPLSELIVDRSHNLFVDIAMWSGAIGLTLFCFWLYSVIKTRETGKKFAFLSILAYSMFQPLSIVHWILLVIIANI